jgi:nucleoside phosphorylase/DNA-binding NarL/FixJ family response regulator
MKILLVDDDYAKAQLLADALGEAHLGDWEVRHESTAQAARLAMRDDDFDLLLIDLHLPNVVGAAPSSDGGIQLFDLLCLDPDASLPLDVLFVTGREDLLDDARRQIESRGAQICHFGASSTEWKATVTARARYLSKRLSHRVRADIVIVTAMQTPELDQVLRLPYGWEAKRRNGDPTTLHQGQLFRDGRKVHIVAACAQRKGMSSAAALAARLTITCRPKYLVMLGICAGIRGKVGLGDVLVGDPIWDWGAGKYGVDDNGVSLFLAAPYQMTLSAATSVLVREIASRKEVLAAIRAGWEGPVPEGTFGVSVGPMASGASVVADDAQRDFVRTQHKDLVGVEMEGYAVMAAADYCKYPKPTALVIKSVCDFADSLKDNTWQSYAAYTSAAFAHQLFISSNFSV